MIYCFLKFPWSLLDINCNDVFNTQLFMVQILLSFSSKCTFTLNFIFQDPYHGPGQAMGLSFSVPNGVKVPSSLANIYKEIQQDLGCSIPSNGNLENWAVQVTFASPSVGIMCFPTCIQACPVDLSCVYLHLIIST